GKELEDVTGDFFRVLIRSLEWAVAIRRVREDNRRDFLYRDFEVGAADALPSVSQWNWAAVRRRLQPIVDIVHAFQRRRLPRVDLDDHALGLFHPRFVVAER